MVLTLAGQSGRYKQEKRLLENNTGEGKTRLVKIESIPQMPILKVYTLSFRSVIAMVILKLYIFTCC